MIGVTQRGRLTGVGIGAIGMGIMVSLGLTMLLGFPYTAIHGGLPFLAMGKHNSVSCRTLSMVAV